MISQTKLLKKTWTHLDMTIDNFGIGTIYINGVSSTSAKMTVPRTISRNTNYFGASPWGDPKPTVYFDEITFYNFSINSAGIFNLYQTQSQPSTTTTTTTTTTTKPLPALINYWSFNGN